MLTRLFDGQRSGLRANRIFAAEAAADNDAFFEAEADIASFTNGFGVIAEAPVMTMSIAAIRPEGIVPEVGAGGMMHLRIGRSAVAAYIDLVMQAVGVDPVGAGRAVARRESSSDEDEGDMLGLFHVVAVLKTPRYERAKGVGLFHGDEELIILFYPNALGIPDGIFGGGV